MIYDIWHMIWKYRYFYTENLTNIWFFHLCLLHIEPVCSWHCQWSMGMAGMGSKAGTSARDSIGSSCSMRACGPLWAGQRVVGSYAMLVCVFTALVACCLLLLHVWFPLLNAKQTVTGRQAECPLIPMQPFNSTPTHTAVVKGRQSVRQWGIPGRESNTHTTSEIIISTLNWILSARTDCMPMRAKWTDGRLRVTRTLNVVQPKRTTPTYIDGLA